MAIYTVNGGFSLYRSQTVDLDANEVSKARKSRDFLIDQIFKIPAIKVRYARLFDDHVFYGSFARKTKIQPLDDIDLLLVINSTNIQLRNVDQYRVEIRPYLTAHHLQDYMDDYGRISSLKIQFRLRDQLRSVAQYANAEIKKNNVAVVLRLQSYHWVFDIVPAFPIYGLGGNIDYFLIPDGKGYWIRTDPRRDQTFITTANQRHNGLLLPIIRLVKYWNRYRTGVPTISSYYLETMIIRGMMMQDPITNMKIGILRAFIELEVALLRSCPDPKGLGEDLDQSADWATRTKLSEATREMVEASILALEYEIAGDHQKAITAWRYVFPSFPVFG